MATTTNYGWETPDDTDLVKDGALAQRTTANAIDSSLYSITGGKNVGMVLVNTTNFSSVSSFSLNNVFTSDFQNYRVILNFSANTATQTINARMRKSGTDNSASYYHQEMAVASTSVTSSRFNNINQFYVGNMDNGYPTSWNIEIYNPQVAARFTTLFSQAPKFTSGQGYMFYVEACEHQVADAFDGISIIGSNNFSGTIRVYGYRNS
jgi:hypothetical protein